MSERPLGREGQVLDGRYRLLEPLGRGGMGVVYRAEHVQLGRPLAVKVLRPELAGNARMLRRFHREALAAGRLGNPHIVQVLDVGRVPGGAPYLVLELVEGRLLREVLVREAPLPVGRAAHIVCQLLEALECAHVRGIVHRDLKPSNVLLTRWGFEPDFVKLLDFGVCKVPGGPWAPRLTRTGALLGTPGFMAPEQLKGKRDVDRRADVWSAGVILYMALAGRRPHENADRLQELADNLRVDAPLLRTVRRGIDAPLESIVARALARGRGERFPSAAAFREALLPYRPGPSAPVPAEPPDDDGRTDELPTTRRARVPLRAARTAPALLLAALCAALAIALAWGVSVGSVAETKADYSEEEEDEGSAGGTSSDVVPSSSSGGGVGSGSTAGARGGKP
jgi:serine/threonine protein kinase